MRLKLIAVQSSPVPGEKGWRLLEEGEMTLGRDSGCTWPLADPDRTISNIHCRISRDVLGYKLCDESTNGVTVDRRELAEKETVRLQNGSSVEFCGRRFVVEITGEAEPDWTEPDQRYQTDDAVPSISAILSDVSPRGTSATGILPGRLGNDWLDDVRHEALAPERGQKVPSRPDIGWAGPPDASALGPLLPSDWADEASGTSHNEHLSATATRVHLPRAVGPVPAAPIVRETGASAEDALGAFLRGYGRGEGVEGDPLAALESVGRRLRELTEGLERLAQADAEFRAEFSLPSASPADARADALLERIETESRRRLEACRDLLNEIDRLDPNAILVAARTHGPEGGLASFIPKPGAAERRAFDHYRRVYRGADGDGEGPRGRFLARLGASAAPADPLDEGFEELNADRPRRKGVE